VVKALSSETVLGPSEAVCAGQHGDTCKVVLRVMDHMEPAGLHPLQLQVRRRNPEEGQSHFGSLQQGQDGA